MPVPNMMQVSGLPLHFAIQRIGDFLTVGSGLQLVLSVMRAVSARILCKHTAQHRAASRSFRGGLAAGLILVAERPGETDSAYIRTLA